MRECRRSYLQACLLLLIAERPDHGYDLAGRLAALGLPDADAATTYRALRTLEREGSLTSCWRPSDNGPSRRVYHLTRRGRADLAECGHELRDNQVQVGGYLCRFDRLAPLAGAVRQRAAGAQSQVREGGRW